MDGNPVRRSKPVKGNPPLMRRGKAIVTLCVGSSYLKTFRDTAMQSWLRYADLHGYDVVVLDRPIDPNADFSRKSLHWQKLLVGAVPELKKYDFVLWLDTDIIINSRIAPDIAGVIDTDAIVVADYESHFTSCEMDVERDS